MARGAQRDKSREKRQAKDAAKGKGGNSDGLTPAQRNER